MTVAAPPPAVGLPPRVAELLERDRWSSDRLERLQRDRLRALVRHAVAASPYYREQFGPDAADGDVALEQLPTLSKSRLMQEYDRIVTDPRLTLEGVRRHATGPDAGRPYLGAFHVFATSGTTGEPGLFAYADDDFSWWMAASLRLIVRIGATPDLRLVGIGAPSPLHMSRRMFSVFQAGRPGVPRLSVTTPLDEVVDALNAYQPEAITTYPTVARLLADEQLEGRLRIAPRIVGTGSEVLGADTIERIESAWGITPHNAYASTEVPVIGSTSPEQVGLHVSDDLVVIEVVDEHGRPVEPGLPGHRLLVTNLTGYAQPLIRYELPDSVVLADGPDPSGRPYRRIARVDGRDDDILRLPGAGGRLAVVHPYRLRAPFCTLPEVRGYQVLLRTEGLGVRVVAGERAPRDLAARVEAALAAALADAGAAPVPVDVELVPELAREPGAGAKLKLVKDVRPGR